MKYNKNEVTGKMRDRIILQNVTRVRSLTGFASEIWTDTTTIWAFAESKLPGSNETIIEGKNTAKNICDFTIRYISSITEESRVVFKNKIYQVKNIKISHDRRFVSFQGVYYDSYSTVFGLQFCSASLLAQSSLSAALMSVIKYQASLNAFGSVSADIALVQKVASSLNAFGTLTGDITFVQNMQAALNGTAALSGGINFVQKPEASLNAFGTMVSDLKIGKTFESSLNANGTLVSDATIAKNLESSLTSSNSLDASALVSKLASASLTGAGTTAANLTVTSSATLLLDTYPNAAVAYSLRKLRSAYTGSAIRVRRSSDNTEQNIGFTGNDLDTTALLAFCGAGNGFVTIWYDQSMNGNNATQTTQANQPQIVSSGNLIVRFGKPYVEATTTRFLNLTAILVNNSNYSFWMTYEKDANVDNAVILNSASSYLWLEYRTQQYVSGADFITISNLFQINTMYLNNMNINYLVGANQYQNNILLGTRGALTAGGGFSKLPSNIFRSSKVTFNELVFYSFNQDINRIEITNNINTYYGIY